MLDLQSVHVEIQNSAILRNVSLNVSPGELICLVGRNGAGKTTTFRTIMGYLKPKSGSINWKGQSIAGTATHDIARQGIAFSPEESEVLDRKSTRLNSSH